MDRLAAARTELHLIANNTRMLMLWPPGTIRSLASCVMAANPPSERRLASTVCAETFVDPIQFAGTMYRAGNWPSDARAASAATVAIPSPTGASRQMYL